MDSLTLQQSICFSLVSFKNNMFGDMLIFLLHLFTAQTLQALVHKLKQKALHYSLTPVCSCTCLKTNVKHVFRLFKYLGKIKSVYYEITIFFIPTEHKCYAL